MYEAIFNEKPKALIRQYELKERKKRILDEEMKRQRERLASRRNRNSRASKTANKTAPSITGTEDTPLQTDDTTHDPDDQITPFPEDDAPSPGASGSELQSLRLDQGLDGQGDESPQSDEERDKPGPSSEDARQCGASQLESGKSRTRSDLGLSISPLLSEKDPPRLGD